MTYQQLTRDQRHIIYALKREGLSERRGQGKRIEWDAENLKITNDD